MLASSTSKDRESENYACGNPLRFSEVRNRSKHDETASAKALLTNRLDELL
jgi:hypothetical protein